MILDKTTINKSEIYDLNQQLINISDHNNEVINKNNSLREELD